MCAGHRGLDTLTAIVDRNRLQQGARTEETNRLEPLADKWRAFGWEVGRMRRPRPRRRLFDAFTAPRAGKPRCVIANTIKGKGVSFIEDRVEWHHKVPSPEQVEARAEGARPMNAPPPRRPRPSIAAHAFAETLIELAARRLRASSPSATTASARATSAQFQKPFPDRLINVGIAEQDMVGVAAGLANGGFIPFVCGAAPFLTGRALEQIKVDVAYNGYPVVLCGMSPGMAYGELGPTHHSIEDLSWLRAIDGLAVVVPADPAQTRAAVRWAATSGRPVLSADRADQGTVRHPRRGATPSPSARANVLRAGLGADHRRDGSDGDAARSTAADALASTGHRRARAQRLDDQAARRGGDRRGGARDGRDRHRRRSDDRGRARRRGRRGRRAPRARFRCAFSA